MCLKKKLDKIGIYPILLSKWYPYYCVAYCVAMIGEVFPRFCLSIGNNGLTDSTGLEIIQSRILI